MFQNQAVFQRIPIFDREAANVVEDHIHNADRPDSAIGVLPIKGQVVGVLALLFHILLALNQEATGAYGGVIDFIARFGFHKLHEQRTTSPGYKTHRPFYQRCRQNI